MRHERATVLGALVPVAAVAFAAPAGELSAVTIAVLGLGGMALVPLLGWLRVLSFAPVAAAGLGAAAAAWTLAAGQAVPLAFAAASAAGVVAGGVITAAWPAAEEASPRAAPAWLSLVAATVVWGFVVPRVTLRPWSQPLLFGIDLGDRRPLGVLAVLLLAAAALGLANVARSAAGREMAAAGAAPELAVRSGAEVALVRLRAGLIGGLFGGWAGLLLTLQFGGMPPAAQVSPAAGVAWIAVALIGGGVSIAGVLAGALVIGGVAPFLGAPPAAVAALGLAGVVLAGGDGLPALLRRRPAPLAPPAPGGTTPP